MFNRKLKEDMADLTERVRILEESTTELAEGDPLELINCPNCGHATAAIETDVSFWEKVIWESFAKNKFFRTFLCLTCGKEFRRDTGEAVYTEIPKESKSAPPETWEEIATRIDQSFVMPKKSRKGGIK